MKTLFTNIQSPMKKFSVNFEFGSMVRWRRAQLGLSQEQLSERADLHRTYISDVERGARNLSLMSISKLAEALEMPVADLFSTPMKQGVRSGGNDAAVPDKKFVDVLLVEDNPDDVSLTLRAFKQARFLNRIHTVHDGVEALDYLFCQGAYTRRRHETNPQLILLDLNLPRMSGIEVLRRIKSEKWTQPIPVVVLTISQRSRDLEACLNLGVDNYIVKPVDFKQLVEVTPKLRLDWGLFKQVASPQAGKSKKEV